MEVKKPYDWQEKFIKETSIAVSKFKQVIAHAPTGAGKSVIMSNIAYRLIKGGKTCLVLSETRKIYDQLVEECSGKEINAKVKFLNIKKGECYVGMIQTLRNRRLILDQLISLGDNLVVMMDECHLNIGGDVLQELKGNGIMIVGFTATPFWKFAKHLPIYYNELVEGPQVDDLINMGLLCSYQHIARTRGDMDSLKLVKGEYTEKSNDIAFNTSRVYDGLLEDLKTIKYNKCVIFVASIKHAEELKEKLNNNGFNASSYHSKTKDGAYEMAKFTTLGLSDIMVTIRSLSKGWDFKPIDLVVLNHATNSTCTYLQELGRGSRVIKGIKEFFTVLDYGENYKRHGLYFENRDYKELWKEQPIKKSEDGIAPVVLCESCNSIHFATLKKCPFCGHERPVVEKELQEGELVDVTSPYLQLVGKKLSEVTPEELSIYAKIKSKQAFGARVARTRGVEYLQEFATFMGYKSSWVARQEKLETGFTDFTLR